MRVLQELIDWKRAVVMLPLLAGIWLLLYFFLIRSSTAGTPRATLIDTADLPDATVGTTQGKLARDFLAYAPDGTSVRLSDFRGRPTVINFWATWCASCAEELPDLRDLQAEVGSEKLNVIAINAGERSGTASRFMSSLKAPDFKVGMDPTLVIADAYAVRGMPHSVFIDSAGVIRAVYIGQLDKDRMMQYLSAATQGEDAANDPGPLRLLTTVAREHVLEVHPGDGQVTYTSKRLRCDDSYCAKAVIDAVAAAGGVRSVERHLDEDPPRIVLTFAAGATTEPTLTTRLLSLLSGHEDPLYSTPLEIRYD